MYPNTFWNYILNYIIRFDVFIPKGRENDFCSKCPDTKIWSSNSGRNEKENWHRQNWKENKHPGLRIKEFQKIPNRRGFRRIFWIPIIWEINKSRSTDSYRSSSVVTTVVRRSDHVDFIPLNLIKQIIWLNHHIQYSIFLKPFPYSQSILLYFCHTIPKSGHSLASSVQGCELRKI